MTVTPSTTQSSPQYIAQLFRDKQIGKVAIIDDADDPRTDSEFYANEKIDFWNELDFNNEGAKLEFTALVQLRLDREITGAGDINDEVLQLLWSTRGELKQLKDPVEQILFPKVIEKLAPLDSLQRHLVDQLKVSVLREGTSIDVEEALKEVSIVFIDYVLGAESDSMAAIERAVTITRRIYKAFSADRMPLIILMSSDARAPDDEERFRDKSKLLRGMFYFAPKTDLTNEDRLFLSLAAWAKTLPTSGDIQRFVKTLEDSLLPVFEEFIGGVKALSLDDYAYIQHLSLQEDGQPLGDYLLWLYNSYLGHLLFESHKAIQEQQKIVDGLSRNYLPPSQNMPSNQLVKMYHSALFNMNVGDLSGHPVIAAAVQENPVESQAPPGGEVDMEGTSQEAEAGAELPTVEEAVGESGPESPDAKVEQAVESAGAGSVVQEIVEVAGESELDPPSASADESTSQCEEKPPLMPYLHLGDIFINDSESYVLMVINAECDLSFGPLRQCDSDGTVMFVRGELQSPEKWAAGSAQTRTELFEYEGRKYRIFWDVKKIFSYQHRDVEKELTGNGLRRKARLRLPFALDVQRAFAANLTRIGMPVSPPIYHPVRLEVWARGEDKEPFKLIDARDGLAFWILTKSDNKHSKQVFLTVEFAQLLKAGVNSYIQKLTVLLNGVAGNDHAEAKKQYKKLDKRIKALETFKASYENWFLELQPALLPNNDVRVLYQDMVGLRRGWQPGATYKDPQQIMINIIDSSDQSSEDDSDLPPTNYVEAVGLGENS